MKITRLAALAKEHKSIVLINTEQDGQIIRQHVMVGMAVYPLDGFAQMDGDELLAVLDVPLEKRKEYSVFVRPIDIGLSLLTTDNGQTDAEASVIEAELRLPWAKILSVYTQSGLLFINADYKRVIEKEKDVTWWSRTLPSGAVVLVAKRAIRPLHPSCQEHIG